MFSKKKKKYIFITAFAVLFIMITILITATLHRNFSQKPNIGIILSGAKNEEGWNGIHYDGIKKACEKADVNLIVKENVKEFSGKCRYAVNELIEENTDMIIISSYNHSPEITDIISDYPDIAFYCNSSEYHSENMTSYFVRYYQARYLSGVLAGTHTKKNCIGYVAAMPNNEVNRGISAFTMGVKSVNPEAEIIVIWTNSWDDSKKEAECTEKLINECDIDLITYHQNGSTVIETAEKYGIDSIGYHQQYEGYSSHYLTSVVCNWDKVYSILVKDLLSGQTNTTDNMWIGIKEDAVGLSEFSELVSEQDKKAVKQAKQKLLSGHEIFSGLIYDTEGKIYCNEGEVISDEELLEKFDWYTLGVKFYE